MPLLSLCALCDLCGSPIGLPRLSAPIRGNLRLSTVWIFPGSIVRCFSAPRALNRSPSNLEPTRAISTYLELQLAPTWDSFRQPELHPFKITTCLKSHLQSSPPISSEMNFSCFRILASNFHHHSIGWPPSSRRTGTTFRKAGRRERPSIIINFSL
jgi:hypothetical protein